MEMNIEKAIKLIENEFNQNPYDESEEDLDKEFYMAIKILLDSAKFLHEDIIHDKDMPSESRATLYFTTDLGEDYESYLTIDEQKLIDIGILNNYFK